MRNHDHREKTDHEPRPASFPLCAPQAHGFVVFKTAFRACVVLGQAVEVVAADGTLGNRFAGSVHVRCSLATFRTKVERVADRQPRTLAT